MSRAHHGRTWGATTAGGVCPGERPVAAVGMTNQPDGVAPSGEIHCERCAACCCRLEVLLLDDRGIPPHLTATDAWGARVMARCDDGWCAALDRDSLRCRIYSRRPRVCRELEMGGDDCIDVRATVGGISRE